MGCDIHVHIEYKDKGSEWEAFATNLDIVRNYAVFQHLAGVRGIEAPVVQPRGLPSDLSFEVTEAAQEDNGYNQHTHSWLLPGEWAEAIQRAQRERPVHATYYGVLAAMRALLEHGVSDVRVVFWFDN